MSTEERSSIEILLLEDSALDADLIGEYLRKSGLAYRMDRVWTRNDFIEALDRVPYGLILADYVLPSFDGVAALNIAREKRPETPFIFVSGTLGEETAIEAMKNGATDYVVKQRLNRLPVAVKRALDEVQEKAARQQAEKHQQLLIRELNHRVKNSLATVQAIANQTLRTPEVSEGALGAFNDRLGALARAHDVLTEERWQSANIKDVIAGALEPYGGFDDRRFHLDGPAVELPPQAALSFAMALHELATNAAKYGALSVSEGRVDIVWSVAGTNSSRRLRLSWSEKDGPLVAAPSRRGFGSRLIERGLAAELQGDVQLVYDPKGVTCKIDTPLPEVL